MLFEKTTRGIVWEDEKFEPLQNCGVWCTPGSYDRDQCLRRRALTSTHSVVELNSVGRGGSGADSGLG